MSPWNALQGAKAHTRRGALCADTPGCGDLTCWARQGVLLLNTVLTVNRGAAHSHAKAGWATFTDAIIQAVSRDTRQTAFLLWGKPAQTKSKLISSSKHLVLTAPHPSPLSAFRGFFGCGHFQTVNRHLNSLKLAPIDWTIQPVPPDATEPEPESAAGAAGGSGGHCGGSEDN